MARTYVDSGMLIWAARGVGDLALRAMGILDDPERSFASSLFVKLETLPKSEHFRRRRDVELYESYFGSCVEWARVTEALAHSALEEARRHDLAAMDALHIVSAWIAEADEIVTSEKATQPIHRTDRVHVVSLRPA